jgi:hypothetical protein
LDFESGVPKNFTPKTLSAEETGFEPADAFTSPVFKTGALNHSATPLKKVKKKEATLMRTTRQ